VVFASFNQLQFFLTEWARFRHGGYTNPIFATAAGYAAIYTLIDRAFPKLFRDTFGHAFYLSTSLRQWAEIGGAFFLTFAVIWFNLRVTDAIVQSLRNRRFSPRAFALPLSLLAIAFALGTLRYLQIEAETAKLPTSKIIAIQANIGDATKIASERGVAKALNFVVDTYTEMSREAATKHPDADAIVWPETAFPTVFSASPHSTADRDQKVRTMVSEIQKPLLFGGYDQDGKGKDYNALYLLSKNGFETAERYRKHILLLFGEELPFADQFPILLDWFPQVGQFGKGPGPELLTYYNQSGEPVRVAPLICYEGLFPEYFRTAMGLKPDFFLNVTNDSWFGPWAEPQLHLSLTTFRAIETRTAQLRATNTGISGLLTPSGNWVGMTGIEIPVAEAYSVPRGEAASSLYKNLGEGPLWFILILGILLPLLRKRKGT
jgi:apolipoprotein N-acyltransferase